MTYLPPPLKLHDTIGIVATARAIMPDELTLAIKTFEDWGLHVRLGKSIGQRSNQFAGNSALRANDFQEMLNDPNIKAIICARGGYGTVKMVDAVDFSILQTFPKWIVGYSDITVLHQHIHRNYAVPSLHATMPISFSGNSLEALESLRMALFGEPLAYHFAYNKYNKLGEANGQLVGGNLSVLYSILASNSDVDTRGKILFLEDLDEYLYHIDRMLVNLRRNGKLSHLAGLIVGGFTDMHDNTTPYGKDAAQIILEHCARYDYPIAFNFPAGHIANNKALIMGQKAQLIVTNEGTSFTQKNQLTV